MKDEEIIKKIDEIAEDKISFRVRNGLKKLKEENVKFANNITKNIVVLDDTPLISLSEEKSLMSASIIKIEDGREKLNKDLLKRLNIDNSIKSLEDGFENIKCVLNLLEDGDYELREVDMIPTDGENNYFWNSAMLGHYYSASCDMCYRGEYIKGFSKFLVPSEHISCIDMDRVNYYREKIRSGEELFGVALELRGFMALLLDGHNKATAAYLEGKTIKCLTIKNIKKNPNITNISIDKYREKENYLGEFKKVELDEPKEVFPDFRAIAAVRKPIDISKRRIENLFELNSKEPIDDLIEVLYYLTIYDKDKAKDLCFEILEKNDLQLIWGICIEYLSRYNDKSVNRLFKEILLDEKINSSLNSIRNLDIINNYFDKAVN